MNLCSKTNHIYRNKTQIGNTNLIILNLDTPQTLKSRSVPRKPKKSHLKADPNNAEEITSSNPTIKPIYEEYKTREPRIRTETRTTTERSGTERGLRLMAERSEKESNGGDEKGSGDGGGEGGSAGGRGWCRSISSQSHRGEGEDRDGHHQELGDGLHCCRSASLGFGSTRRFWSEKEKGRGTVEREN